MNTGDSVIFNCIFLRISFILFREVVMELIAQNSWKSMFQCAILDEQNERWTPMRALICIYPGKKLVRNAYVGEKN